MGAGGGRGGLEGALRTLGGHAGAAPPPREAVLEALCAAKSSPHAALQSPARAMLLRWLLPPDNGQSGGGLAGPAVLPLLAAALLWRGYQVRQDPPPPHPHVTLIPSRLVAPRTTLICDDRDDRDPAVLLLL